MELTTEDTLKLNVLLASKPQAIRIDESAMTVHGLAELGEKRVSLNPNCQNEVYLRRVKELISGHVLGSPGGYPVYLRRWTRMGQAKDDRLEPLLLLGEPEAVVAVVHAPGLTQDLARRAWWAMPTAENARRMLEREAVARGDLGRELAAYLLELLPFETEPMDLIDSVRLILQPGLIDQTAQLALWQRARQKTAYLVGFLIGAPDALPEQLPERTDLAFYRPTLASLAATGNTPAGLLLRVLGGPGQTYLKACLQALSKPPDQDVVTLLLDTLAGYFGTLRFPVETDGELSDLQDKAAKLIDSPVEAPELAALRQQAPGLEANLRTALVLSRLGYPVVRPILSKTTATGALMRRKLEPVLRPLAAEIESLTVATRPIAAACNG